MKTLIHTINVISDNEPNRNAYITDTICRNKKYRSIFDFNKPSKQLKFDEFAERCKNEMSGLASSYISRVDIAWDSEDKDYFKNYTKHFRYLLTALEIAYRSKNSFDVRDLITADGKSYWVKTSYFEATFYNKDLQIEGKNEYETTTARFEMRFKRLVIAEMECLKEIILKQTENRLNKALECLKQVEELYNEVLINKFKTEGFRKVSELIIVYQDRIFSKRQLVNLLIRLDKSNTNKEKMADNLKYRYKIEYITERGIRDFIKSLYEDMMIYFN